MVIDDGCKGKAQGFCQLNRFIRLFITHLPRFLHRSIILVWYYFFSLNFCFPSHVYFSLRGIFSSFSCFYSVIIQLFKLTFFSFVFAVIADEQKSMPPPHGLTLDGGVGSSLNQPSTTFLSVTSSKLEVSNYGPHHSFLLYPLLPQIWFVPPSTPPPAHASPFPMFFANLLERNHPVISLPTSPSQVLSLTIRLCSKVAARCRSFSTTRWRRTAGRNNTSEGIIRRRSVTFSAFRLKAIQESGQLKIDGP